MPGAVKVKWRHEKSKYERNRRHGKRIKRQLEEATAAAEAGNPALMEKYEKMMAKRRKIEERLEARRQEVQNVVLSIKRARKRRRQSADATQPATAVSVIMR